MARNLIGLIYKTFILNSRCFHPLLVSSLVAPISCTMYMPSVEPVSWVERPNTKGPNIQCRNLSTYPQAKPFGIRCFRIRPFGIRSFGIRPIGMQPLGTRLFKIRLFGVRPFGFGLMDSPRLDCLRFRLL